MRLLINRARTGRAKWFRRIRRFRGECGGNVALTFVLAAATLGLAGAGTVDYASMSSVRTSLQGVADAAATAAARELYLSQAKDDQIRAVARSIAEPQLAGNGAVLKFKIDAGAFDDRSSVVVTIDAEPKVYFSSLIGWSDPKVKVRAKARILGSGRVCAIALEPSAASAISLNESARLTARECSVYSNSSHRDGITALNTSRIISELTCSTGGVRGSTANFSPQPEIDCPPIADPLGKRPPPPVGGCTKTNHTISLGVHVLSPGVYCGGLTITDLATAMLRPGVYVMKDGPLVVSGTARLIGVEAGFYFTGKDATFLFTKLSVIVLSAPTRGPLAGLLFFEDRADDPGKKYRIESNFAQKLNGTFYLPRGDLEIAAQKPIGLQSAYTIVVSRRLTLTSGPDLVLNSDYEASDVPVPDGVGPIGGNIVLTE